MPDRDTSQFQRAQEATTHVYPLRYAKEERRWDRLKLAISQRVAVIFANNCVTPRAQYPADTASSECLVFHKN